MRDPKTHAKVLALREQTVEASLLPGGSERAWRLTWLSQRIDNAVRRWEQRTGWRYIVRMNPPHWRHTTIIPDTEETEQ